MNRTVTLCIGYKLECKIYVRYVCANQLAFLQQYISNKNKYTESTLSSVNICRYVASCKFFLIIQKESIQNTSLQYRS